MTKTIRLEQDVLAVLSNLDLTISNGARIVEKLDRPLYMRVNKALEALGGKWNRKTAAHVFGTDPGPLIEDAILTGQVIRLKQEYDFFETPPPVIRQMLALAEIEDRMQVLEPSAGSGALADAVWREYRNCTIHCVEFEDKRAELLKARYPTKHADFMEVQPDASYDRIVMNPPFSRQQDIDHVNHALRFLKPGGRLVAVMGAGVTFRTNMKTLMFRDRVGSARGTMHPLPEGSFKASGTNVNTVLVVVPRAR